MPDAVTERGAPRGYWPALALVALLLCLPLATLEYAPLVDLPNHLARSYVLHHYDDVPEYRDAYLRVIEPIPNLAMDIVAPPLIGLLPVLTAARVFVALEILLFVAGVHALGRALHGRPTWLAVPLAFCVLNSMFLYGFLNYMFGVGLFCLALAAWLESRERWTPPRLLYVAALTLAAYLAHLTAYGCLAAAAGTLVLHDAWRRRRPPARLALDLLPLLPPLATFLAYMRGGGEVGSVLWSSPLLKLVGLSALTTAYDDRLRLAASLATPAVLAVAVVLARRVELVRPALLAGGALGLLYLALPYGLVTSLAADLRLALPAALLLVLSLRLTLPPRTARALLVAAVALGSLRLFDAWRHWRRDDARTAALVARLQALPERARVYSVFLPSKQRATEKSDRALQHVIEYATITRRVLTPTLFAFPSQQPIRFRHATPYATPEHADPSLWLRLVRDYDFAWTYGLPPAARDRLRAGATPLLETEGFTLWRVHGAQRPRPDALAANGRPRS
jgi:hypothetical protein